MVGERRGAPRRELSYRCWIITTADDPVTLAHISDISKTGALLITAAPRDLPDEFTLNLTEDGKVRRRCRIARRTDDEIAITFLSDSRR